jgi:hypothetical protein
MWAGPRMGTPISWDTTPCQPTFRRNTPQAKLPCCLLHANFLLRLVFKPENWGDQTELFITTDLVPLNHRCSISSSHSAHSSAYYGLNLQREHAAESESSVLSVLSMVWAFAVWKVCCLRRGYETKWSDPVMENLILIKCVAYAWAVMVQCRLYSQMIQVE